MNKDQYLQQLREVLRGVDEVEVANALAYCEEYFEEADSEEQAISELGSPSHFGAVIKADCVCKSDVSEHGFRELLQHSKTVFDGIRRLPLSKLGFLLISLIYGFGIFTITVLSIALLITVVVAMIASIPLFILGISELSNMGNACVAIGTGFICISIAILVVCLFVWMIQSLIPSFYRYMVKYYNKMKGGEDHVE